MRRRGLLVAAAVIAVTASAAYAKTVSLTLGDGTKRTFVFRNGFPDPVKNDWIRMSLAGGHIRYNKEQPLQTSWFWSFGFLATNADIRNVQVYDVTSGPGELLLQAEITLDDAKTWKGESEPFSVSDPAMAWLCDKQHGLFIFKVVVTDSAGQTRELFQPSLIPNSFKDEIKKIVGRELCT